MNDCLELTEELALRDLLMNISINNEEIWGEKTTTWLAFFYLYIAIFVILFCLLIALALYVVTQRKRAERPRIKKVNTFYAINILIIVLGVLRVLHLILDPHYAEGWITGAAAHHILSIVFSMGFPSLTASYLLVFITLWMSRKIRGGFKCIQKPAVLIPLCAFQYVVTFTIEMITLSNQYELTFVIIGCDFFFCAWGIFICVSFLMAGYLLVKSIGIGNRSSIGGIEDLQTDKEDSLRNKRYTHASRAGSRRFTFTKRRGSTFSYTRKGVEHRQRAMMKVTIVTCVSAILGILYSIVLATFVAISLHLLLQNRCVNSAKSSRAVWLLLQYLNRSLELLLCLLLLYAVADTTKMMKYLFKKWKKCGCGQSDDDSTDANIDYVRSVSELDTDASDRGEVILSGIKARTVDITRLPSVTEETISQNENGGIVYQEEATESDGEAVANGRNGTTTHGTGFLRHQYSNPTFEKTDSILNTQHHLSKSRSDSSITLKSKLTTRHRSNEIS